MPEPKPSKEPLKEHVKAGKNSVSKEHLKMSKDSVSKEHVKMSKDSVSKEKTKMSKDAVESKERVKMSKDCASKEQAKMSKDCASKEQAKMSKDCASKEQGKPSKDHIKMSKEVTVDKHENQSRLSKEKLAPKPEQEAEPENREERLKVLKAKAEARRISDLKKKQEAQANVKMRDGDDFFPLMKMADEKGHKTTRLRDDVAGGTGMAGGKSASELRRERKVQQKKEQMERLVALEKERENIRLSLVPQHRLVQEPIDRKIDTTLNEIKPTHIFVKQETRTIDEDYVRRKNAGVIRGIAKSLRDAFRPKKKANGPTINPWSKDETKGKKDEAKSPSPAETKTDKNREKVSSSKRSSNDTEKMEKRKKELDEEIARIKEQSAASTNTTTDDPEEDDYVDDPDENMPAEITCNEDELMLIITYMNDEINVEEPKWNPNGPINSIIKHNKWFGEDRFKMHTLLNWGVMAPDSAFSNNVNPLTTLDEKTCRPSDIEDVELKAKPRSSPMKRETLRFDGKVQALIYSPFVDRPIKEEKKNEKLLDTPGNLSME